MKFHKFCAGMLALLAAGVVWSASDSSNQEKLAQKYEAVVDEKAAAARTMLPAEVQPQAPAPKPQQRQALTPQQWSKTLAGMPQAEVFQGFSVHSKHFCSSCHGKQGLADTPNWPDVAGQPSAREHRPEASLRPKALCSVPSIARQTPTTFLFAMRRQHLPQAPDAPAFCEPSRCVQRR